VAENKWLPDDEGVILPNGEICHGPRSRVTYNSGMLPCPCGRHAPLYYSGLIGPIPGTGIVCSGAFSRLLEAASGQLAGQQQYVSGMFADSVDRLRADVAANGGVMNVVESQVFLCSGAISAGSLAGPRQEINDNAPIEEAVEYCPECAKKDALIAELTAKIETLQAEIRSLYGSH
jgi:hypothetical protein